MRAQKILLEDVQLLTLRGRGAMTTSRRHPVPQLKCTSRQALCDLFPIDLMRCTNQGSLHSSPPSPGSRSSYLSSSNSDDDNNNNNNNNNDNRYEGGDGERYEDDIEWACVVDLPASLALAHTRVLCEPFAGPFDAYILRGSCGVEYALRLTPEGERAHPHLIPAAPPPPAPARRPWLDDGRGGEDLSAWLFALLLLLLGAYLAYSHFIPSPPRTEISTRRRTPLPPSNEHAFERRGVRRAYAYTRQRGWTPGFWSGLAGPSPAGYLANRDSLSSRRDDITDRYDARRR